MIRRTLGWTWRIRRNCPSKGIIMMYTHDKVTELIEQCNELREAMKETILRYDFAVQFISASLKQQGKQIAGLRKQLNIE